MLGRRAPRVATLVVGGGPSSASLLSDVVRVHRSTKPRDCDLNVVWMDPRESMWEAFPRDFRMGQSMRTLVDTPYQRGRADDRFMKVGDYTAYQKERTTDALKETEATPLPGKAMRIRKNADNDFQVVYFDIVTGSMLELAARKVLFAPGPGPERSILADVPRSRRPSGERRPFSEYIGAVSLLTDQVMIGSEGVVGVIGDGPTALWAAQRLAEMRNTVVLLGPDQPSAFAASNPGGRNSPILRGLSDRFFTGRVLGIEERNFSIGSDWREPGTTLVVENYKPLDFRSTGKTTYLPLSAIVSAIGPTTGLSPVVDPALLETLTVVPGASALMTQNEDFVLFGAGAYYHARGRGQSVSFDEAGQLIRQPPVGIAAIDQGGRQLARSMRGGWALEQYLGLSDIHPQSASGDEIFGMLRGIGVDPSGAREMTTQVVEARSKVASQREWSNRDMSQAVESLLKGKSLADPGKV